MNATQRRGLVIGLVMALLAVAAVRDFSRLGDALPWRTMDEFPDFYCAGWGIDRGLSPYTYEPLHTCEHRVSAGTTFRARLFEGNPSVAVPAPQPPFDFAPFAALARLPFAQARCIDAVAILLSVGLCIAVLAELAVPWQLSAAALALSTAYIELNTAQIVPFSLLALVLCGLALARRADTLAGVAAGFTAIEPTVGLPVVLAMLIFVPRSRAAVAATLFALTVCSIAFVGPRGLLEYVTAVLPAHAASEPHFPFQYSFAYALAYFGVAPAAAQAGGAISYLALLAVGLALAPRASAALRRRELLAFIPAFCSVVGGAFLHQEELCFALPTMLTLTVVSAGRTRVAMAFILCVLAIPWIPVWGAKQLFLAALFVCAVILLRLRIDGRAALGFLCVVAAVIYAFELHPPQLPVPIAAAQRSYAPSELVQREWRDYTEARSTGDPLWFAIKLPTWAALFAGLAVAAAFANGRPKRAPLLPPAFESNP